MENYLSRNRSLWDAKVAHHLSSDFYDVKSFLRGETSLKEIELSLLGNIKGLKILHLQCHFGQDSIALSRLGARVTGVDFSEKATQEASRLAQVCGTDTTFITSDIYELPEKFDEKFDLVYTTYGTIGWLPDLKRWADVVTHFLKPGGRLVFVEFHPVIWMFDDNFTHIKYSYFNKEAIVETEIGTYAEKSAPIFQQSVTWNHPISDVLSSLLQADLQITSFQEYNWSPYACFSHNEEFENGKFRIPQLASKVPHVYSLTADKTTGKS